jgi:hypothetical protein
MRNLRRLVLFVGATVLFAPACRARVQTTAPPAPIFERMIGTWGWLEGDLTCQVNPHTISFSRDLKFMHFRYPAPVDTATGRREAQYEVRSYTDTSFRVFLQHESRRDSTGQLVEWDLVLLGNDRYTWHRSDWPAGGTTNYLARCAPRRAARAFGRFGTAA